MSPGKFSARLEKCVASGGEQLLDTTFINHNGFSLYIVRMSSINYELYFVMRYGILITAGFLGAHCII